VFVKVEPQEKANLEREPSFLQGCVALQLGVLGVYWRDR
jgi:hypothetical protein